MPLRVRAALVALLHTRTRAATAAVHPEADEAKLTEAEEVQREKIAATADASRAGFCVGRGGGWGFSVRTGFVGGLDCVSCVSDGLCVCSFVPLVVLCVFHLLHVIFVCSTF